MRVVVHTCAIPRSLIRSAKKGFPEAGGVMQIAQQINRNGEWQ